MNALPWFFVVLLTAATLFGCDADSGSTGSSADPGDGVAQGDTSDGSSVDTSAPPTDVGAASSDAPTVQDALEGDTGSGPNEVDTVGASDGGEQGAEDTSIGGLIVGDGACTNDSDLAALAVFDLAAEQMKIGMACYEAAGGPGQTSAEVVNACFIETLSTEHGFSLDCSACITNHLMCLLDFCMDACSSSMMSGQSSPGCDACIEANGCKSDFEECSGLNPDVFSS